MQVKGKDNLFSCPDYRKFFKSIQGIEGHTLFDRYRNIESLIRDKVAFEFQDFLAEPIIEDGAIEWYGKRFFETPRKIKSRKNQLSPLTSLTSNNLPQYFPVK